MRQVKRVTFARGGAVAGGVACTVLLAANVAVFLLGLTRRDLEVRFADNALLVASGEYYRMLTSAFLHAGLLHLGFNMFALYIFGSQVEAVLGVPRFLALYALSAVGGSACSITFSSPHQFSVGASGAVFGIFGAYFVIARSKGLDISQIGGLIAINLFLGAVVPQIDNAAHVGGLLTGAAVAVVYEWGRSQSRSAAVVAQVLGLAAVAAVIAAVTMQRVQDLPRF